MTMTEPNGRDRRRARPRKAIYGTIVVLLASLVTAVFGAAPAHADGIPCPNLAKSDWTLLGGRPPMWRAHVYSMSSATPVFNVSDARTVDNTLDTPVSATFTSQQSRTFTLQVTAGTSFTLASFLSASLNVTIVQSRTTSLGVSATATVAPHSRVNGLYGLEAYNVIYGAHEYRHFGSRAPDPGDRACIDYGSVGGQSTNAPTYIEGWRIVAG